MIGVETGTDNPQFANFDWAKEWGVNFGKIENQSGASGFISEPGCDAVFHQRWQNKDQKNERQQNKTEHKQRFFP
jgi:hypothetical protein